MLLLQLYLFLFFATTTLGDLLFKWFPTLRLLLIREGGIFEWVTVMFFAAAALVAGWAWGRLRARGVRSWLLPGLAAASVLGILDELSFGADIFGWEPRYVAGVQIDAVHDLFLLVVTVATEYLPTAGLLVGLVLVALAGLALAWRWRARLLPWLRHAARNPTYQLLAITLALLLFSLITDLGNIFHEPLYVLEELFEMNGALAVLLAALGEYQRLSNVQRPMPNV